MKLVLGIVLLVLVAFQIYVFMSRSNIEKYKYAVIKKYDSFEVRQYDSALFTSVKLPVKEYKQASSRGFSILAGYIFGGNEKNEKMAMTSPVAMSMEDSITMMFLVPEKMSKQNMPQPKNSEIIIVEIPAKKMAAIRFGGWASDEKIKEYRNKLTLALAEQGIQHSNRFSYFGYNAPFDLFFRRNEVVVEL